VLVLGIHDGHDSSACLIKDGRVLLASAEERRSNKKNHAGVPKTSIKEIFRRTGVNPSDVDLVSLGCKIRTTAPEFGKKKRVYKVMALASSLGRWQWATSLGQKMLGKLNNRQGLYDFLKEMKITAPVVLQDHHTTHAACAYFHRPWTEDTLVLTLDGAGDGICATVQRGSGSDLKLVARTPKFHSIPAQLYSNITLHLGLRPYEHEYKVMGMAPYGQAKYCIDELKDLFGVEGMEFRNYSGRSNARMQNLLHKRLKHQRFDNISAATQEVFEDLLIKWVKNAMAATGLKKIACCGGAFLNVKANKLIRELPDVEDLYIYPASDDGGTSEGAAILGYVQLCKQKGIEPKLDLPKNMYLGLEFSDEECLAAIKENSEIEYEKMDNVAERVGELLAHKHIIARFSGREEWGPRALGNRSILADPRDMGIIRKLNFAIKQRDFWMPFAASILEEDRDTYIKNCHPRANFMIEAFDTKQPQGETIVAGTHPFDKTVRPQLVNELNPDYRDILRAFKRQTGVGALLNTSFNLHGFPIVGTPQVAIYTLLHSELDALALGSYLVWKKNRKPAIAANAPVAPKSAVAATVAA
jgi:carbamoyltransferase